MRKESVIALEEKLFLTTNGINKEKLEQYIIEGMPYYVDNKSERVFYGNAIDWIRNKDKRGKLLTSMKKGLNPNGV